MTTNSRQSQNGTPSKHSLNGNVQVEQPRQNRGGPDQQLDDPVCEDCLNATYDLGSMNLADQQFICMEIGADIADHICNAADEPDLEINCLCACQTSKLNTARSTG